MTDHAIPARWLDELFELLRIPSISADPARSGDIEAAAEWVAAFVRNAGGRAELVPGASGRPLVVGEIAASTAANEAPTVLLYGHVDVQPAGDPALWDSDPFEPELRDGWIYARGTADDKGNLYLLLRAAAELAAAGRLPVNVRVVCDAEEESGGNSIVRYLEADEGPADACIIFDSSMPQLDVPAFDVAARGIVYWHLTLRTGARDLHSGLFGGAALNAAHAMIEVLQAIAAVPDELREGEEPPSAAELAAWQALEPGAAVLAAQGARPLDARAGEEFYVRTGARAAVDVNGIRVGEADLQKTVLPVEAVANVSIRLAPGQRAELIAERAERLLAAAAPEGAELTIARLAASDGALFATDSAAIELASSAFERVVGRRPLLVRVGGSLPILPALAGRGIPTIVTGFDLPEGNIHAPNERLLARYVPLGVEAAAATLEAFASLPRVPRR